MPIHTLRHAAPPGWGTTEEFGHGPSLWDTRGGNEHTTAALPEGFVAPQRFLREAQSNLRAAGAFSADRASARTQLLRTTTGRVRAPVYLMASPSRLALRSAWPSR